MRGMSFWAGESVKSKDVVHECETEFGVFPASDVIDIRKRKFIVITIYASCAKIVTKLFDIQYQSS